MTRKEVELAAMQKANKRKIPLRFLPMLFNTELGMLLLDWEGSSWNCRWFDKTHRI